MLYLFRVSTIQEIRIYPSANDTIDGINASQGYLSTVKDWSSLQLLASVENSGSNKQWLLHSDTETQPYSNYQKMTIANNTLFSKPLSTTEVELSTGFRTTFTALSTNYMFDLSLTFYGGGSFDWFYFSMRDKNDSDNDLTGNRAFHRPDETDTITTKIQLLATGLSIGQEYQITPFVSNSSTSTLNKIHSGDAYPRAWLGVKPLYNATEVVL